MVGVAVGRATADEARSQREQRGEREEGPGSDGGLLMGARTTPGSLSTRSSSTPEERPVRDSVSAPIGADSIEGLLVLDLEVRRSLFEVLDVPTDLPVHVVLKPRLFLDDGPDHAAGSLSSP